MSRITNQSQQNKLVFQNQGLINKVIKTLQIPQHLFDDCFACGQLGLIKGIRSYHTDDNHKRCALSTWLYNNVKWEIVKFIKNEVQNSHKSLYNNLLVVEKDNFEEYLPNLTPEEQRILYLRLQSYNLTEIATDINLKEKRYIYEKYKHILRKIRNKNQDL